MAAPPPLQNDHVVGSQYLPSASRLNDTVPHLRAAGICAAKGESTADAMNWSEPERPPTPTELKKYRQSTVHAPGKISRHFGAADDPIPQGPFGRKGEWDAGVPGVIKNYPETDVGARLRVQQEAKYDSHIREPLGRGYQRGHVLPEEMGTTRPFGRIINAKQLEREGQARTVIFPTDREPDNDPAAHKLYVTSHNAVDPGEQRRRGYDWGRTGVDPLTHKFGAVDKDNYHNGVAKALAPHTDDTIPASAPVQNAVKANFKETNDDYLGTVKRLGAKNDALPADHVYGQPSMKFPEVGVETLLTGEYSQAEQEPDADLGKSLREGWRNIAPEERTFGVPSIRLDVPAPRVKSVANDQNYGNEPDALQLLKPCSTADRGVNAEDYLAARARDELMDLVISAGVRLERGEFEAVYEAASEASLAQGGDGAVCIETFMAERHAMRARMAGL